MRKPKSFKATLENGGAPSNWTIIRIPFDAAKLWGKRGNIRVNGEANGVAFNAALLPNGRGGHYMLVNKRLQKAAAIHLGDIVAFTLESDDKERKDVPLPAELARVFRQEKGLQRWFAGLNRSTQNAINAWVAEVKGPDARGRRAEQIAERMLETMEAEVELPPLLQVAFRHAPVAYEGWLSMTPTQRRNELLGVFYYRTPEGRARRIDKLLAMAEARAAKSK